MGVQRICVVLVMFLALITSGSVATAATRTVLNANDSGAGSLRATIAAANSGDTIAFAAALSGQTITLTSGELLIDKDLTITGPAGGVTVSGNHASRVFKSQATVSMSDLTIWNGTGSGIFNNGGMLTLTNSTVSGNTAGFGGGGIYNGSGGTLNVMNSTVSGNSDPGAGGGVYNQVDGTVNLTNSTVSGNSAANGGGIFNFGSVTLTNSTVSANSASVVGGAGGGANNQAGGTLTLTNSLVIANTASYGGGVHQNGDMNITNSTVSSNAANHTGGIWSSGSGAVDITDSTVSGNSSLSDAGGITNAGSTMTITKSTIMNNDAGNAGGGINNASGIMNLTNSTVSGNHAGFIGGIFNVGTLSLTSVTVSGNSVASCCGGIRNVGTLTLTDSIVATQVSGGDCANEAVITSLGHNLDSDGSCELTATGDISNANPLLGPLALNAPGTTQTHALQPGSPAIDAGDNANCPATDQRGVSRPLGSACDIGAYEYGSVGPPTPVPTPTGGTIAFQRGVSDWVTLLPSNAQIYVMKPDGTGQFNLSNNSTYDESPSWSPDGTKIAFERANEIYVMNSNGSNAIDISANSVWDASPAWSPDGNKIAFSTFPDDGYGDWDIAVMNADGSGQVSITNSLADDYGPAWSPDGTKIAFSRTNDVWVMNANGTSQVNVSNNGMQNHDPAWSPDGTKIAFVSYRDGNYEIYVMNANGSSPVNVTDNPASDASPAWSPDGTKIAFSSARDGNREIYVMNANGTGQVNISNNPAPDVSPDWTSAGSQPPVPGCYRLTTSVSPAGAGTVSRNPSSSGGCASSQYAAGTVVSLTPNPDVVYQFSSWSGDTDCTDGSVTMSSDKTCTANFTTTPGATCYRLTTSVSPAGAGTVSRNPTSSGGCADSEYKTGAVVSLTHHAGTGYKFKNWSGDTDCTDGSVTVTKDVSCTANFTATTQSVRRAILYITGIASSGDCNTPFAVAPENTSTPGWNWISEYLKKEAGIADADFLEYLYADGTDDATACSKGSVSFDSNDSCWSLDDEPTGITLPWETRPKAQAAKLAKVIDSYLRANDGVELTIIAHSQGGVLAAYTLDRYASEYPSLSKVKNLIALDSPLRGINWAAVDTVWKWNCRRYYLLFPPPIPYTRYDSAHDMAPWSQVVKTINDTKVPSMTRLFTVDANGGNDICALVCGEVVDYEHSHPKKDWTAWGHIQLDHLNHDAVGNGSGTAAGNLLDYLTLKRFIKCAVLLEHAPADCEKNVKAWEEPQKLLPQQSIDQLVAVRYNTGILQSYTEWPGSTVLTTLISPHGRIIDAATNAPDVSHDAGPTFESFKVKNPEPGQWTVRLYGQDVPAAGETTFLTIISIPTASADADGDRAWDDTDNCPGDANNSQEDSDSDGMGDACDPDNDNDSVPNEADNCEYVSNADQLDVNANGVGDACDPALNDFDGDGVLDGVDNCPLEPNPSQADTNANGLGDACDAPAAGDTDCDKDIDAVDALQVLRNVAGLPTTGGCVLTAGDVDCDDDVDAVDALNILRFVASLPVNLPQGCPQLGTASLAAGGGTDWPAALATATSVFAVVGFTMRTGKRRSRAGPQ